jgi:hypothetical protein
MNAIVSVRMVPVFGLLLAGLVHAGPGEPFYVLSETGQE